ncbi:MAG: hypothetical protein WD668_04065, partial [Saccharospirillum sp.]
LAKEAGVPLIPVTHNSGDYWLNKRFVKLPGTIDVIIHPKIDLHSIKASEGTTLAHKVISDGLSRIQLQNDRVSKKQVSR